MLPDVFNLESALVLAACYVVGTLLSKRRGAKVEAMEVAGKLRKYGLDEIPKLLEAYAMTDVKGMVSQLKYLAQVVRNEEMLKSEFNEVFTRLLDKNLDNPILRDLIQKKLNEKLPPADVARSGSDGSGSSVPAA